MDKLKMKEIRKQVRASEIRNDLDYANSQPNENELEKFICGSCGVYCSEYTYNEDTDTDECNKCKQLNN